MNGVKFLLDTNMVIGLLKGSEPAMMLAEKTRLEIIPLHTTLKPLHVFSASDKVA
jgi:hypothetical protein